MTYRPDGTPEVQPNTLRDQRTPNTLRRQAGPGDEARQDLNSGGGKAAARSRPIRRRLPLWIYAAIVVVLAYIVLLLLSLPT